jgi:acyl transferase domain-containing protein
MTSLVGSEAEGRESRRESVGGLIVHARDARPSDIAIVGMSGIFPGAPDLETFWENLQAGRSFFKKFAEGRASAETTSRDSEGEDLWGAFLDEIDEFDADFFAVSPREAARMDPQQRLFLKVAWKAFEDAGYRPSAIAGASVGVFVGVGANEYLELGRRLGAASEDLNLIELYPNLLPNRVSNFLNLCGPSELIDTACSSSLVAIHRASMSLAAGECAVALAGGVNLLLTADRFRAMKGAGMLSPDGSCRVFDARVNGIVRGEGVGALLLKPLRQAIADGDSVYAVIKGSAANHSGRTASLLASNPVAQLEVISQAFLRAEVDAATVSYAEAQGSGTEAGDALEVRVLQEAWGRLAQPSAEACEAQPCRIGTLKPNVGHLEAAAGVAAVIKTALALKHGRVPRVAQLEELNPTVQLGRRFEICAETSDWPRQTDAEGRPMPRRACVNVFAYGGTNAHIVLEEFLTTSTAQASEERSAQLLTFSARDGERLRATLRDFQAFLRRRGDDLPPLADIAYTLQTGRVEMRYRLAIVAATAAELSERLEMFLAGTPAVEHTLYGELPERGETLESFGRDAEDKSYLRALWEQGRLRKVAALWVNGAAIQWSDFPRGGARRRVSLPGYAFARTRFWWPSAQKVREESRDERAPREIHASLEEVGRTKNAAAVWTDDAAWGRSLCGRSASTRSSLWSCAVAYGRGAARTCL